jgi:NADPH-dependent 2,4-dienoyl-CoA reductase/sulfur reductase-like enzyme
VIEKTFDIAVIGGGPAGLASAISAKKSGVKNVIILDRNSWFGGILPQCIHDGFGVEETGIFMTGPEYAEKYLIEAEKIGVELLNETMVTNLNKKHEIKAVNKKGVYRIKANAIILAMGCREKTRWNVMIPGDKPSGIYTAGVAQAFINLYNIFPGKDILILGSGDVGLIMARRLKLEGANVLGVVEILPYPSGLPRNVVQCLEDYDIPLFLNHTVTLIEGNGRLKKVTVSQVDDKMVPILGTERIIECDTLLLSVGLTPENELSKVAGIKIDYRTGGPIVNQDFETSISGIFACGNCLQVYDNVDLLSMDAKRVGKNASNYICYKKNRKHIQKKTKQPLIQIIPGNGIKYVIPQFISKSGEINFDFRVNKPSELSRLSVSSGNKKIFEKKIICANPANIIKVKVPITKTTVSKSFEVKLNDR